MMGSLSSFVDKAVDIDALSDSMSRYLKFISDERAEYFFSSPKVSYSDVISKFGGEYSGSDVVSFISMVEKSSHFSDDLLMLGMEILNILGINNIFSVEDLSKFISRHNGVLYILENDEDCDKVYKLLGLPLSSEFELSVYRAVGFGLMEEKSFTKHSNFTKWLRYIYSKYDDVVVQNISGDGKGKFEISPRQYRKYFSPLPIDEVYKSMKAVDFEVTNKFLYIVRSGLSDEKTYRDIAHEFNIHESGVSEKISRYRDKIYDEALKKHRIPKSLSKKVESSGYTMESLYKVVMDECGGIIPLSWLSEDEYKEIMIQFRLKEIDFPCVLKTCDNRYVSGDKSLTNEPSKARRFKTYTELTCPAEHFLKFNVPISYGYLGKEKYNKNSAEKKEEDRYKAYLEGMSKDRAKHLAKIWGNNLLKSDNIVEFAFEFLDNPGIKAKSLCSKYGWTGSGNTMNERLDKFCKRLLVVSKMDDDMCVFPYRLARSLYHEGITCQSGVSKFLADNNCDVPWSFKRWRRYLEPFIPEHKEFKPCIVKSDGKYVNSMGIAVIDSKSFAFVFETEEELDKAIKRLKSYNRPYVIELVEED